MKNLFTYLKALWGAWGNLQSKDVRHDCRLTVGSPSGLDAKWKQNPFMRFAVVLTLIFTIGVGQMWGDTYTGTIPKITSYTNYTINGVSWTVTGTSTAALNQNVDGTKGAQIGTGASPATSLSFSTSGISGTITSVTINTSGAKSVNANVSVTIGGSAFGGAAKTITNSAANYIFTGSASGNVVISWSQSSSKALYVKTITIEYSTGSTKTLSSIAITTQPTTTKYLVGETFSKTGAVVTATYSDKTTANVSASTTWTSTALTPGSNTITASYTEGGVTKTATTTVTAYTVTVQKKDEDGTTIADAGVSASVSGRTLTASAGATKYVFKTWKFGTASGTSIASAGSASTSLTETPTAAVTVIAEFYKPIPVSWNKNGSLYETTYTGYNQKPVFPDAPSSCDATSDTFYGWTTAAWTGALDDVSAKTIYTSAASMPAVTGAVTYYAVFAKETTSSDTYIKGTSADLTEGQTVVIVNKYYEVALSSEESGNGYDAVSLSPILANKFTSSNTSILWTVEVGSSGFYFKQGDYYINASPDSKGNHYLWFDGYSDEWTLTGSGPYVLYSTEDDGYQMEYYYSSDYFTTYTGTSGNAYNMDFYIPEVTYSKYLTNCCTNLGSINGSVSWSNAATAVVSWDNLDHVSSWTVKYKTHAAGAYTTWAGEQSTAAGRRSVTITGLTPCTNYDFQIIANPASGYCDKDQTIEDSQTHNWTVTSTGVTNATASPAIPSTTCSGFSTTISPATGYALPADITVTNASKSWNSSTGALSISSVTGNVSITITPTCVSPVITADPADASYYVGDAPTALSVTATLASGTLTYLWKVSTNGGSTWSDATGTNNTFSYSGASLSTASAGTLKFKCIVGNSEGGCSVESGVATITVSNASYFPNGKTIFIQAESSSAWSDANYDCVKAWFHTAEGSETAQTTYWLFDATGGDSGKKLFAAIVPATGDLPYLDIQRFTHDCSDWRNKNGGCSYSDANGSNTIRSTGNTDTHDAQDDYIRWNATGVTMNLMSSDAWLTPVASMTDQGSGVWSGTYEYTPSNTSTEYVIATNYNGNIGNTGSNSNATLSGMVVGSTYDVTATLDIKDHSLEMSKTFVKGTVHFNLQGHGLAISDLENVTAGSKISAPSPAPSATGYTFGGWFTDAECTDEWNFATDEVDETMTLYAKWTAHEYTITKTLTNVTSSPAIPSTYTYTGAAAGLNYTISPSDGYRLPTEITVSGTTYTWNPATGALALTGTISSNVTITIVAVQTHTVTWKNNGENYVSPVVYDHGATLAFPAGTPSAPSSCSEKVFVGWTAHSEITSETSDAPELISAGGAVNADATYRAVFADASGGGAATYNKVTSSLGDWSGEYLIVHEVSSTSGKCMDGSIASGSIDANYNSQDVSISSGSITSTSSIETYRWIVESVTGGYNIKSANQEYYIGNTSQKNKAAANGLTTTESSSTDEGYVLTFAYSNSKTTIKASKNGDTYLVYNNSPAPADPVTVRFRFYKASTCGNGEGSGNYSAVALYKKTSGISYDNYITQCCALKPVTSLAVSGTTANSVTLSWTAPSPTTGIDHLEVRNASTDAKIGSDITNLATTTATISGLTECETYSYKIVSVGDCETSSDAIDAQPYSGAKTVTYKYHDDVTPDGSFTTDCDNTFTTLPNPSRTGYTFNGWYDAATDGNKIGNGGASYAPAATITLHAQWSENNYTVTMAQSPAAGATLTGGTTTAHYGGTINISTDVPDGYRFTGWTASPSVTFADASATSTSFSMPASDVTITANFVQIHTLSFVVPDGGGSAVTPPATADHGGTVTLPDVTGISSEYSCETFIGWTTTAPVSGTWASTPSYKAAGATSDAINAATTFYAVYRRPGVGPSGSIELTCSNVVSWRTDTLGGENNPYGTTTYFTTTHSGAKYRWQTDGQIVDAGEIQLKENYAIKIPTVPGRIDSIFLKFSQGNETDACAAYPGSSTTRAVYFNSSASTTSPIATSNTDDSRDRKIKVTGDYYTGYILNSTQTSNVHSVRVKYGAAPIISHTLKCECPIEQFDLTYDANTTYFPGSETTCTGESNYAWAAHDDIYTICATEPTCEGYKFIGWNTDDNGDGDMYDAGQVIKCVPTADVTLYAQYERVYTVTFNNQGATTAVTQDSYGAEIAVPSATTPCSSDWAFVGWSETAIAPMSMIPSIEIASGTSTYTPTKDVTLYAIYRKTSESSAFVAGMSGAYKIKATYEATDYYAGTANTALAEETNAANAVAYYIKYTSADGGKYTIQRADAKYITTAEDGTNLSYGDSEHYWTITKVGDLWSVQSIATSRYLRYNNGTGFKAYTTSQNANYVSFVATDGQYYYRTMSCASDYDITFHANGSTINWADGHAEASYKDLVDATVVSTFPTATFDGWTFLGWRRSNYSESTSAPESSTIFGGSDGTSGNTLTISSADEDLYPVFTRFEDNEPFDQVNGGDYFIYFLESGSDDGYGDERRVYAAAYGDSKRYNSSALCSSATEFTFTKLANGNWTIYDKTTNKYLYAEGNDWLKQKTGTSGAEWTLTVNGSAFDAYCVGTDFGQISAYGDGASATFQNYARTNISGGSPNPLYHRVYLGGCSNRTFTTNPSITPEIEIHGQAKVTSTATKSVKARTALTVTASDISTANLTVTSDNSAFKFCLTSNGTYTASVNIPVVSNKVGVTPIYLEYTPTATSDGIEGAIITVSDGAGTPTSVSTVAGDVQGRHLPANFVIAAKLDDRWYALPANCTTSTSSTAGILIEVDDVNDPTTATLAPDYTKYGLREVASTRYAANGANVTFVEKLTTDPAKEYTLYNGSTTSVQVNAQWSGYYTTNPERYEWILNSDDFEDYTITSATTLATDAGPRTVSLNTSGVWGTLLNSKSYDGKVRLLPATFYEESPAQIVEWKASAVVVMYTGTETSATTKVGTGDVSAAQTLSTRKLTHGIYELSTDAFTSNAGKMLWLTFGDTKKAFEIPWIISSEVNAATGHDKHDVVILKNGKLTAVSTKYSFRNVYVYGGGKLDISSGSLGVNNIILRAGGITTSGIGSSPSATYEYIYPQVKLGGTLTSTKTNIQYEYITDYEHWFHLCLPFNATLSSITYPQEYYGNNVAANNKGSWLIKRYAGEVRATGSYEAWKDIEKDSPAKTEVTAGFGYIFWGAPKKVTIGGETQRQKWGIQRMTMSITAAAATTAETSNKNISVDSYTGVATSTKPNDQGWNLVGNPYMTNLTGLSSTSLIAGELVHTDTDPWDGKWKNNGDGIRYVTIPDNHFDNYEAKTMDWFTTENPMVAGRTFFVQIAEGESTLTFATANRASLMPALFAKTEQAVDIETGIVMSDESKHDEVNFWIKDGKTAEYEYNADYPKTPNNSHFNLYGVHEHGDLSWIAISPEIAEGSMAIGYQVPTAGEYRLSLSETYVSDKIEQLLVTDHEMSPEITTNLMVEDYIFQVNEAETNNTRFTVSIKIKSGTNTATDIDDIRTDSDHPIKFLYRDKIYILRGGQIYDTTGKQVKGGAQ